MFGFDGLVELLKAGELGSETAFGGCVDDEDDFAFVVGERVGVSLFVWWSEIVESCGRTHGADKPDSNATGWMGIT